MAGVDRRRFLKLSLGAAAGVGAVSLAGCSGSSSDKIALGDSTTTTAEGAAATIAPDSGATPDSTAPVGPTGTFRSPEVISSVNGVLEATLAAVAAMVPFGDGERWAYTYGGSTPGPTLRARPGDLLKIRVVNQLDDPTNLHTHGLHVSPEGNSDNVFVSIDPGSDFLYEIQLPTDHRGGTYWYHPHRHGFVAGQVSGGMAGMIIIDDNSDDDPVLAAATERVMVLSDPRIGSDPSVISVSRMDRMGGREGDVVTINGIAQPVIEAATGTLERWRLVNASSSRYYRLVMDGAPLVLIGTDGGLMGAPVGIESLLMAPGERAELLVPVASAGPITLRSQHYDRGGAGMGGGGSSSGPDIDILTLNASGPDAEAAVPSSIAGAAIPPLPTTNGTRALELSMGGGGMGGGGMSFMIDGRTFDPDRIDNHLTLGDTEEWTITNVSEMDHPFHIHIWQFHVVDASDKSLISPGLKDTVNVPAGGWVKFVLDIVNFPGKAVYHCHILDHEDQGMMGVFETAV